MRVDVYTSTTNSSKHLSVPEGQDPQKLNPVPTDPEVLSVRPHKKGVELDGPKPPVGIDPTDVKRQIADKGHAIHGTSVSGSSGAP